MSTVSDDDLRYKVLQSALKHVAFDGWTETAMNRAADELGLPHLEVKRLYPNGIPDVINGFYDLMDLQMKTVLLEQDLASLKIRDRIAACVRVRLMMYEPHREAVRRLVSVMALPGLSGKRHIRASLFRTADQMWRLAGDTSTDFNYYTKRTLLMAVYSTTLLHWLDDDSDGYAETWTFLDRRIANVMLIQKAKGNLNDLKDEVKANMETMGTPEWLTAGFSNVKDAWPEALQDRLPSQVQKVFDQAKKWGPGAFMTGEQPD